jgi:transcriptional adapter 2-alpha
MSAKKQRADEPPRHAPHGLRACSTCHRDITDEVYVKCARCAGFDQCLECFSVGAEAHTHFRTHPFLVLEPSLPPLFQEGWSSDEEIHLLGAIQACGLGNWPEVAELMRGKSAAACEAHYFATYADGPRAPAPGDAVLPPPALPPPPAFDTAPRESRPSVAHERNLADARKRERTTPAEFAGWMPRRSEFESEYLNDAEQIIGGLGVSETAETPASLEQKLGVLRAYDGRIKERELRTHFAIEWDLLSHEFRSFGGRNGVECEMEEALMPLAQIVPRDALIGFVNSLQNEMRLKEMIEMYKKWHMNGIATHDEGLLFNQLQALVAEERLTPSVMEKWNRDVVVYLESPEFRATLDRQLLSAEENQHCQTFGISPHSYLRIKDLLLREFTATGSITRDAAIAFMPGHEQVMGAIYDSLQAAGFFCTLDDVEDASSCVKPAAE